MERGNKMKLAYIQTVSKGEYVKLYGAKKSKY